MTISDLYYLKSKWLHKRHLTNNYAFFKLVPLEHSFLLSVYNTNEYKWLRIWTPIITHLVGASMDGCSWRRVGLHLATYNSV